MRTKTSLRVRVLPVAVAGLLLAGCGTDPPAEPLPVAAEQDGGSHHSGSAPETDDAEPVGTAAAADDGHTDHAHLAIADSGVGTLLKVGDGRGHRLRELPVGSAPSVALRAVADPAGGWTVQLVTERFRWAPEDVNSPADTGAGHAHLYVGDRKVARVYGEWFFLSADAAEAGDVLTASLNAHDHTAWAVDGAPVAAEASLPEVAA